MRSLYVLFIRIDGVFADISDNFLRGHTNLQPNIIHVSFFIISICTLSFYSDKTDHNLKWIVAADSRPGRIMAVIDMTNANEQNLSTMIKVLSNMLNAKSELHKQRILIEAQKAFPVCTTFDYLHVHYIQYFGLFNSVCIVVLLNSWIMFVVGNREFICFFQIWWNFFNIESYTYAFISIIT